MRTSDEVFIVTYVVALIIGLVASFLLAIIPSKIAGNKGYSRAGFYWFGFAVLPAAIIVACVLKNKNAQPQPQVQPPQDPNQYQPPQDPGQYQQ